ncbi:replication initiator [Prauserella flavalba]|uniref:replication initiator n=1 Tax=Prauserella flavalba TaxID=1477506 RepID=UPI00319E242E
MACGGCAGAAGRSVSGRPGGPRRRRAERAALDPEAEPAHVVRFGTGGIDIQGVNAGTDKAGRCLGYLVKYLTKELDACYEPDTDAQRAHLDRLADALRWEPCSESCANWLLYGIQPAEPSKGLVPGACKGKAHRPANLGYRGRRCLVSRKWSGRNLTEHRAERREHVMKVLGAVGARPELDTSDDPDGTRYQWVPIPRDDPNQPDRTQLLLHSIAQQRRWKQQYQEARHAAEVSATDQTAA